MSNMSNMSKSIIYLIFIFIIIISMYILLNIFLKKNIESYGIYCGSYNLKPLSAQQKCTNDIECIWNNYNTLNGESSGWCGQNPSNNNS